MNWDYFDKFDDVINAYMPARGEGDTIASQIVTAVNKLVYKWYNDGDVFDNTYYLSGWCNDLSSYANWLYKYTPAAQILAGISEVKNDDEYEQLLVDLADMLLDSKWLKEWEIEKTGSIYDCDGPFVYGTSIFEEEEDDEWEEDDEDEWED